MRFIKAFFVLLYLLGLYALFREHPIPMPKSIPNFDKLAHFGLFFSLASINYFVFSKKHPFYYQSPLLLLALSSEWIQSLFLPLRHFSLGDATANLSGFLAGFVICFLLNDSLAYP